MGTFPYGESWYNATNDKLLFTTYERDAESGNDFAQARYNVNRLGRFSSPDPIAGSTSDPQSLNRYAYVRNKPVIATDPSGLFTCTVVQQNSHPDGEPADESTGLGPSLHEMYSTGMEPEPQSGCQQPYPDMFPIGGGDEFDAFIPTGGHSENTDCLIPGGDGTCALYGSEWVTDYGNLGLLSLLGADPGDPQGPDGTAFKKSLYEKLQQKINDCIKKLFSGTQVPQQTFNDSPNLDVSRTGTQLAALGVDTSHLAPGDNSTVSSRPDPSAGRYGTVQIASEQYNSRPTDYLQGLFVHELGNILSYKYGGDYYKFGDPNGIGLRKDKDTGANLQNCVSPSSIHF